MSSLFEQLSSMRSIRIPCALQPCVEVTDKKTGAPSLAILPGTTPIEFEICQITSNELSEADAVLDAAKPPPLYQEENRPGTMGSVKVLTGYDHDDPGFLAHRQRLLHRRSAMICLAGCPALGETTPGETTDAKVDELLKGIGAIVLNWLANKIEQQSMFAAAGEDEVAIFLARNSGAQRSSSGTKARNQTPRKKGSSKKSTGRRSASKSGKRRGSGS